MQEEKIKYYFDSLNYGKESPSEIARIQIELAAQAAYVSESLKTLRNKKPEFFLTRKVDKDGKKVSNEMLDLLWQKEIGGLEITLKTDLDILDRFLQAAKSCLIALNIESKVQE